MKRGVRMSRKNEKQHSTSKQKASRQEYMRLTDKQKSLLEDKDIDIELYYRRRKRGWSYEKIINTPARKRVVMSDEEKEIIKRNGIDPKTFHARISRGWDRKRALHEPLHKR